VISIAAYAQAVSFNTSTGTIDVDYAGYLSKHDIVYNQPITNPVWGATVGNGRVGAMVWSANGLTMQVGGVDTSEQTAFSGGLRRRWRDPDGAIYEWDYQHGTVEVYDRRGFHRGEFNPSTGERLGSPIPRRTVEP